MPKPASSIETNSVHNTIDFYRKFSKSILENIRLKIDFFKEFSKRFPVILRFKYQQIERRTDQFVQMIVNLFGASARAILHAVRIT